MTHVPLPPPNFQWLNSTVYNNEKEVGDGLKLAHLPRDQIWVTTKWGGRKPITESINDSLEWLGVDYVDLYLIHNPAWVGDDLVGAWREMEKIKKEGKAKSIGVSKWVPPSFLPRCTIPSLYIRLGVLSLHGLQSAVRLIW